MRPASRAPQPATHLDLGRGKRRTSLAVIGFIILGLTLGAIGHVAVHAKRLEVALALGEAERIHHDLAEQRRQLEIEIGMLKDPGRVIAIARDKLLMRPVAPGDIRPIGPSQKTSRKGMH